MSLGLGAVTPPTALSGRHPCPHFTDMDIQTKQLAQGTQDMAS